MLFINGGPGATSMMGLFLESGPLRITRNGTKPGRHDYNDFEINPADKSWADDYNMIYLD